MTTLCSYFRESYAKNPAAYLAGLLLFVLLLRLISLGAFPLVDTTESRYAEIAREMVMTHNWMTPQIDPGKPFLAKPPLAIWAIASSFKLFGISAFSARLSSFFFSLLTLVFVYLAALKLSGKIFALKSVLILATTGLFYPIMGLVMLDPGLSAWTTLSMISLIFVFHEKKKSTKTLWGYLFFAGIGLSIMTKGLIGVVLILIPAILWVLVTKYVRNIMKSLPLAGGFLLMLAIAVPWHILAETKTPGFLKYYLIGEHLKRFLFTGWQGDLYGHAHSKPRGLIIVLLLPAILPWLILFIANLAHVLKNKQFVIIMRNNPWVILMLIWFLMPVVFFSFAGNILITYLLPGIPAFAILTTFFITYNRKPGSDARLKWYVRTPVFLTGALILPVLMTVLFFIAAPEIGKDHSFEEIAEYFLKSDPADARLICTRDMPNSLDFYSKGYACPMKKTFDMGELAGYIRDNRQDYFVIYEDDMKYLPEEKFRGIYRIKNFGEYSLYRENWQ